MFVPSHFDITDKAEIDEFIKKNDFGILVSQVDGLPFATHLPFHRSSENVVQAHLAKANPQWQNLDGQKVLIVLAGNHDYVSPTWYESPGVPTWNYQAVHISGVARCFSDKDRLLELVKTLSTNHERGRNPPWDGEFDLRMLNAIVGVEIEVDNIQCKYKLSQNRPIGDRLKVIEQLTQGGNPALAEEMHKLIDR